MVAYRGIAIRRPSDIDALLALGELLAAPAAAGPSPFDPATPATTAVRVPSGERAPSHERSEPSRPHESIVARTRTDARGEEPPKQLAVPTVQHEKLFSSLDEDELDASLAFAFGEAGAAESDTAPFRDRALHVVAPVASPPMPRPGPPARPAKPIPSNVKPAVIAGEPEPESRTTIEFDAIVDSVNTGEHEVPNVGELDEDATRSTPTSKRSR